MNFIVLFLMNVSAFSMATQNKVPLFKLQTASRFKETKISEYLDRTEVFGLLQAMLIATEGIGYLEFGHPVDLDHGHLLVNEKELPFAILYHSQEFTDLFKRGSRFNRLDRKNRNWLQSVAKPTQVIDARKYLISENELRAIRGGAGTEEQRWGADKSGPGIGQELLDERKLGQSLKRSKTGNTFSVDFHFFRVQCENLGPYLDISEDSNLFSLMDKSGEKLCVSLGLTENSVEKYATHIQSDCNSSNQVDKSVNCSEWVKGAYRIYKEYLPSIYFLPQ